MLTIPDIGGGLMSFDLRWTAQRAVEYLTRLHVSKATIRHVLISVGLEAVLAPPLPLWLSLAAEVACTTSRPTKPKPTFLRRYMVLINRGLKMWFKYTFLSLQTTFVHEHDLPEAGGDSFGSRSQWYGIPW